MERFRGFVGVQSRGTLALPPALRRRYHLDEPGAQVEITEREDGVLEVRPVVPVPATQAWFWTSGWQRREREVDEHITEGRVVQFDDVDAFLGHLDGLEEPLEAPDAGHARGNRKSR